LYPEFDSITVNNDIALIQLETPFELTDYLRPVCLPAQGQEVESGTRCYVAGWGKVQSHMGKLFTHYIYICNE
jgi:hypothetical protein